jgi:hypothetical protein
VQKSAADIPVYTNMLRSRGSSGRYADAYHLHFARIAHWHAYSTVDSHCTHAAILKSQCSALGDFIARVQRVRVYFIRTGSTVGKRYINQI